MINEKYPFKLPENYSELTPGELLKAAMQLGLGKNNSSTHPPTPWDLNELGEAINSAFERKNGNQKVGDATSAVKSWRDKNVEPQKYRQAFFEILTPTHRIPSTEPWAKAFNEAWAKWRENKQIEKNDINPISKSDRSGKSIKPNKGDYKLSTQPLLDLLYAQASSSITLKSSSKTHLLSGDFLKNNLATEISKQGSWQDTTPQNFVFRLLFNTARLAFTRLIIDHSPSDSSIYNLFDDLPWSTIVEFLDTKQKGLNVKNITTPNKLEFFVFVQEMIATHHHKSAKKISNQFPDYVSNAYWSEWRRTQNECINYLGSIYLDNPMTEADIAFKCHHDWLISQARKPLFSNNEGIGGEPFSLNDIYVDLPLHPFIFSTGFVDIKKEIESRRYADELFQQHLASVNPTNNSNILFVRGGPGSGKSSLLRQNCAKHIERIKDSTNAIIHLPLQRYGPFLNTDQTLIIRGNTPEGFPLNKVGLDILDTFQHSSFEKLTIVLDGLDELGHVNDQINQINAITRTVNIMMNTPLGNCISFIIAGRDQIFHQINHIENVDQQTYRLIGMAVPEASENHLTPHSEYDEEGYHFDLRLGWLEQYCRYKFTDESFNNVDPKTIYASIAALQDITFEPLLLYLIARVTTDIANSNSGTSFDLGKVFDISSTKGLGKNDIYDLLIDSIRSPIHRKAATNEASFDDGKLAKQKFRDVLACLAIAAWRNGTGRRATVEQFLIEAERAGLEQEAQSFIASSKSDDAGRMGLTLLSVFYFQTYKESENQSEEFEFTHKSFASYLVAVTLFDATVKMISELQEFGNAKAQNILQNWIELIGQGEEESEVYQFIRNEADRYVRPNHAPLEAIGELGYVAKIRLEERSSGIEWAEFEKLIMLATKQNFKIAATHDNRTVSALIIQKRAMRILFGIWGAMVGTKQVLAKESYFPTNLDLNIVPRLILEPPTNAELDVTNSEEMTINYVARSLKGLNLGEVDFAGLNLTGADFSNSNITDVHFEQTIACLAEFDQVMMKAQEITSSNFNSTHFFKCDNFSFYYCLVRTALFEMCDFENSTFKNTDFSETDFNNCTFQKCTFNSINFNFCSFVNTKFIDCNFTLCDFEDSDFIGGRVKNLSFEACRNIQILQ